VGENSVRTNIIYHGDCLVESDKIESGSVDLILTDPPYGIIDNYENCEWDKTLNPKSIFEIANRILRKNGRLILFAKEPYTSELMKAKIPNINFNQKAIWVKDVHGNGAQFKCNKALLGYYEEILIFQKKHPLNESEFEHPLRKYFADVMDYIGFNLKEINNNLGHRRAEHSFYINSTQFGLCTKETYQELINEFNINKMQNFKKYKILKVIDGKYKKQLETTFNLPNDKKFKKDVFEYNRVYNKLHPTEKPQPLLEDLIKTYTNEGDLVVDLTAGSGSTGVAAKNTGRDYILIEKEEEYYNIILDRLEGES